MEKQLALIRTNLSMLRYFIMPRFILIITFVELTFITVNKLPIIATRL